MAPSARSGAGGVPSGDPGRAALNLLGLAARAGGVVSGVDAVRRAARAGKVARVLIADDASEGQLGKLIPLLRAAGVPYHPGFDQERLGRAIGRAPVSAVGIVNQQFANRVGQLVAALPRDPFAAEP